MFYRLLTVVFLAIAMIVGQPDSWAKKRTSTDVKREKQRTEKQIAQTKKKISQNDLETGRQLDRLKSLKASIDLHGDTIRLLRAELDSVNAAIKSMNDSVAKLEKRENTLKKNYARTLRMIRSRRQGMSDLSFIFSAGSFGEAWRRMRYLNDIAKTSTKQAKTLALAKDDIVAARAELEKLRQEQSAVLARQTDVQTNLRTEQASADNLVKNLKRQGASLKRELDRRNKQAKSLAVELDKIVEEEIRQAEERRRREAEEAERRRREAEEKARAEAKAREEAAAKAAAEKNKKNQKDSKTGKTPVPTQKNPQAEKPAETTKPQKPETKPKTGYESEAEKDRRLTGSFASNKGRLLFPVAGKYTVVSKFGTNELPELSKVKVDNLGIDIEVPKGTSARAVFEGVVSSIFRLDGYNNIVIVRHGEYLTVYAGIDTLKVKKGDKVSAGQTLGTIFTPGGADRSRLHFEIRHEKQKLNPAEWVK